MKTKIHVIATIVLLVVLIPLGAYSKSQIEARKELGPLNIQYSPEAFVESAANGDMLAVTLFLEAGMDVNEKHGGSGMTALIAAASKGRIKVVRTLLEKGADVNAKDNEGKTALMRAAEGDQIEITQVLIEVKAELVGTALYISYSIENASGKAWALTAIAGALAEAGNFDRALDVAQTIEEPDNKQPANKLVPS